MYGTKLKLLCNRVTTVLPLATGRKFWHVCSTCLSLSLMWEYVVYVPLRAFCDGAQINCYNVNSFYFCLILGIEVDEDIYREGMCMCTSVLLLTTRLCISADVISLLHAGVEMLKRR